jgi:hypothetical protein
MVFAAASGNFSFIIFLIVMIVGFGKMGTLLKGNATLRKGIFWFIFRK